MLNFSQDENETNLDYRYRREPCLEWCLYLCDGLTAEEKIDFWDRTREYLYGEGCAIYLFFLKMDECLGLDEASNGCRYEY